MYKEKLSERTFHYAIVILLILLSLTCIIPFLVVISTSISDASRLSMKGSTYVLWPSGVSLRVYRDVLDGNSTLWPAYAVTIFRVVVGTTLSVVVTSLLAYGLSKPDMPGRNLCITLIFFTMLFGGGLIPTYLVIKSLGLTNTLWVYVIPGMVSTWNFMVFKNFFTTQIPASLEEAAIIDGANALQILVRVVLPLSKSILATIALFCAVGQWNAWFDAAIYNTNSALWPVQIIMRNILNSNSVQQLNPEMMAMYDTQALPPSSSYQCAVIIISTLPILVVYPFVQKYFVKGVLIGSVKG